MEDDRVLKVNQATEDGQVTEETLTEENIDDLVQRLEDLEVAALNCHHPVVTDIEE